MVFILFFIIGLSCLSIFLILNSERQIKNEFKKKVIILEAIIVELKANLEIGNQKVQLSEELRGKINEANKMLSTSILHLNLEMFEELNSKK